MRNPPTKSDQVDQILLAAVETAKEQGEFSAARVINCFRGLRGFISCFGGIQHFLELRAKDLRFLEWLVGQVTVENLLGVLLPEDAIQLLFGEPAQDTLGNRRVACRFIDEMIRLNALDDEASNTEFKILNALGPEVFNRLESIQPVAAETACEIISYREAELSLAEASAQALGYFLMYPLETLSDAGERAKKVPPELRLTIEDLLIPIRLMAVVAGWETEGKSRLGKGPPRLPVSNPPVRLQRPVEPEPLEPALPVVPPPQSLPPCESPLRPAPVAISTDDAPEVELTDEPSED